MESVADIRATISQMIPDGLVVPEHDDLGHQYRHVPTNQVFRSVTTKTGIIDNPRLKRWAAQLAVDFIDRNWQVIGSATGEDRDKLLKAAVLAHEDELKDAGGIGTQGHDVIERYLKDWIRTGVRPKDIRHFIIGNDARLWAITRSAEKFFIDFDVIPIASELKVVSLKHKYTGTLDSLMMVRKGDEYVFCIVDFKTSNSIDKPEYTMQVAAYYQALYEMTGLKPKELLILQLDKDRLKYTVMRVINRPKAFRAFKHAAAIYDFINEGVSMIYPFTPKKDVFLT